MRFLIGEDVWKELRKRASKTRSLTAVVSYLGRHPAEVIRWPKGARVVSDLSDENVRRGICSAKGALELLNRGVSVHRAGNLHAKVYVFDKAAFVGSANCSESSTRLIEAGVLVTQPDEVKRVRAETECLVRQSAPLNAEILRAWAKDERRMIVPKGRASVPKLAPFLDGRAVRIFRWYPDNEETGAERAAKARAARTLASEHKMPSAEIVWMNGFSRRECASMRTGDWIIGYWVEQRKLSGRMGQLDGPWEFLAYVDLGARFDDRRYPVALVRRRARTVRVTEAWGRKFCHRLGRRDASAVFGAVPVARIRDESALRDLAAYMRFRAS